MDIITAAIIAALAGLSKDAINDSYKALKSALKKKFGSGDVVDAVERLEKKPNSKGRRATLQEEIKNSQVNEDLEIVELAQDLLNKLQEQPQGQQVIQQTVSNVKYAATSGTGTASISNIQEDPIAEN